MATYCQWVAEDDVQTVVNQRPSSLFDRESGGESGPTEMDEHAAVGVDNEKE